MLRFIKKIVADGSHLYKNRFGGIEELFYFRINFLPPLKNRKWEMDFSDFYCPKLAHT